MVTMAAAVTAGITASTVIAWPVTALRKAEAAFASGSKLAIELWAVARRCCLLGDGFDRRDDDD